MWPCSSLFPFPMLLFSEAHLEAMAAQTSAIKVAGAQIQRTVTLYMREARVISAREGR